MAAADKDLGELRKEHKDLSDYTGRVAIIFLTILFLLTISFSRAWDSVQGESIRPRLCEIYKVQQNYKSCRVTDEPWDEHYKVKISYVFGFQYEHYDEGEEVCKPSSNPCPSPTPSPSSSPCPNPSPLPFRTPCDQLPLSAWKDQKEGFFEDRTKLEDALEKDAKEWFSVKAPVPGIDTKIDLRSWVFTLPILFCLCGIYLHILRKKQIVLEVVATQRLQEAKPEEVTEVDRLYFEGDRSFLRFPSKLTTFLFVTSYLLLPAYLIYDLLSVTWSYRKSLDLEAVFTALFLVLICAFYAGAYGHFASNQLGRQISALGKPDTRRNRITYLLGRGRNLLEWLARGLAPAITLAAGSLLMIGSLFLSFATELGTGRKGYHFVMGRRSWRSEFWAHQLFFGLNRLAYISSLLLAILSLLLIILPAKDSLFKRKWIRTLALGVVGSALLLTLVDVSISVIYGFVDWTREELTPIRFAALLITGYIWLRAFDVMWKGSSDRRWRDVLLVFFAPFYLICVTSLGLHKSWGLLASFLGTGLLLVGFAQLQYLSGFTRNSRSPNSTGT